MYIDRMAMNDGTELAVRKFEPETPGTGEGCALFLHGMMDHGARYIPFARELYRHGFAVWLPDLRGHGLSAKQPQFIGLAEKGMWKRMLADIDAMIAAMKNRFPALPLFLIGHSMGSLLARRYAQLHGDKLDGMVAVSTRGNPGWLGPVGVILSKLIIICYGEKHRSRLLQSLTFFAFNCPFRPNRTAFDWLNSIPEEVDAYIADPFCGKLCSARFFHELIRGVTEMHRREQWRLTPSRLPVLFVAGDRDPLGNMGRDIVKLASMHKKYGLQNIEYKLYAGARHELLLEQQRELVCRDIIHWMKRYS